MQPERNDKPLESLASKQESVATQVLMVITLGFVGATAALTLVASQIAANIQRRPNLISPPPSSLMVIFYVVALLSLLGSILWMRSRTSDPSLPYKDFQTRIFSSGQWWGLPWRT